jgi:hypothetical protein
MRAVWQADPSDQPQRHAIDPSALSIRLIVQARFAMALSAAALTQAWPAVLSVEQEDISDWLVPLLRVVSGSWFCAIGHSPAHTGYEGLRPLTYRS